MTSISRKLFGIGSTVIFLAGCSAGTVTQSDTQQVRENFSQDNYEKAMREAGRGAELEAEKQQAAARGEQ